MGMPAEVVSCVGCHERPSAPSAQTPTLASRRAPSTITPYADAQTGFSFKREIQPVLDRHCIRCHNGEERDDGKVIADLRLAPVKAVIISECLEDAGPKAKVLAGVCSVFDKSVVYGGSTYGSFSQTGVAIDESVGVLAMGGKDIRVATACQTNLGTGRLIPAEHDAEIRAKLLPGGAEHARKLPSPDASRLMIVIADAHSPKNGPLVEGIQSVTGGGFPILGGCVNKNAGQTFVYFRGKMLSDAAIGLMLSGDFKVALAGRSAKENAKVIATAQQGAAEALKRLADAGARPAAVLAFDGAGRKGKLDDVNDELAAFQKSVGTKMPLFGSYNAGEIGPADVTEKKPGVLSGGMGWHVMIGALGG
ncbi:FIST C-terminal domain-containing protein [bacterium]|nr:FIST C-terminal domain-containing protein [bacterium]